MESESACVLHKILKTRRKDFPRQQRNEVRIDYDENL